MLGDSGGRVSHTPAWPSGTIDKSRPPQNVTEPRGLWKTPWVETLALSQSPMQLWLLALLTCAAATNLQASIGLRVGALEPLVATCPPLTLPLGRSRQELGARSYHIFVPASYRADVPAPRVVYAHGWTDSCGAFTTTCGAPLCGWHDESSARGFIFVSLCGELLDASFNAGTCCPPASLLRVDDVGFARALVANVSAALLCIDAARVWAAGFSNGGMLSQRLLCEASDVFSAAASVAGVVALEPGDLGGLAACTQSLGAEGRARSDSMLDVHG